jgi:cytochrome b6-f complex iron-sulfur subunit
MSIRERDTGRQPDRLPLLRLFPRAWRERYEAEFRALIADRPPTAREQLDIVLAALDARLRPQAWALGERADRREAERLVLQASGGPSVPPTPGTKLTVGGARGDAGAGGDREHGGQRRFSRRTFLRNALLGGVGVVAAGGAVAVAEFGWNNRTGVFGKQVVIPLQQVPPLGAAPFKHNDGKFWLINNEDGLLALYWKCPHLGCTVPWEAGANEFHCPCHRSVYDRHGVLISGPAPRPMDLMAIARDESGNLIIDTGDIRTRESYEPEQAFRL